MKHHKYIGIISFIFLSFFPVVGYAGSLGLNKPTGGRVLTAGKTPLIVCAAMSGPIFIRPFNISAPGPFFIRTALSGKPKTGGYLLGNYKIIPDLGTCTNPETGVPIPAFELKPYGVSK